MEKLNQREPSLKSSFVLVSVITVFIIFICSVATIYGCYQMQRLILPDADQVWLNFTTSYSDGTVAEGRQMVKLDEPTQLYQLSKEDSIAEEEMGKTEYVIEKIESSYALLSPKEKLFYQGLSFAMVLLPLIYSVVGISVCAWWFYKKRLVPPLELLASATEQIRGQNLDFTISYERKDELGQLCDSFDEMRRVLYENNRKLWNMLEERRVLQASVAHDLRNPIAIIGGYVEYLQKNVPQGKINLEKLLHTLDKLSTASKRLECYTNSIRDINRLEELEVQRVPGQLSEFLQNMADDLSIMAQQNGLRFHASLQVPFCTVQLDPQILYRILENLLSNSVRFAKTEIWMSAEIKASHQLVIRMADDGAGFPEKVLQDRNTTIYTTDTTGEHFGIGLIICRILCQKLGGHLELANSKSGGAEVTIYIAI